MNFGGPTGPMGTGGSARATCLRNEANLWWGDGSYGFGGSGGRRGLGGETVGTEGAQGVESAVIGAIGGDESALQAVEDALAAGEGVAEHDFLVEALPFPGLLEFDLPELRLDFAQAAEEPVGGDQGIDEDALFGSGGLEAFVVAGGESIEGGGVFATNDERFGVDAGLQGVLRRGSLAFSGARAGGLSGIATVGLDLGVSRHEFRTRG